MKQIKTLIQKEFRVFFNSPIGYVFLISFLVFSGWMFFRTFFLFGQADMRDFFSLLPWTFLFLVPAFTMRSWSEEFRSGTIETLLTSGLSTGKVVLGKFFSIVLFLIITLASTLPFAITVSSLGDLDWGVVWISYLGALLLGSSYVALGIFISALTRNQIVAFLISIATCFFFYVIGENFITIFFSGGFGHILQILGLGSHYSSMIRGIIDSRDILFFFSFIFLFIFANITFLTRKFWPKLRSWKTITTGILVISILLNLGSQYVFARFDGTENKQYSISDESVNIVKSLDKNVSIKLFLSDNMPAQVSSVVRNVKDLIEEYQARGKNLSVEILNPLTDDTAKNWAQNFGLPEIQLGVIEKDKQQVVKAYFGLVVTTEDKSKEGFTERFDKYEIIIPIDQYYRLKNDLEYQITTAIKKASQEKLPSVAFLTDHNTKKLGNMENYFQSAEEIKDEIPIRELLTKNYEIKEISFADENFDNEIKDIKTIVIIGPDEEFTDEEAEKIKKLNIEGKNIIFLADNIDIIGNSFTQNKSVTFQNILGEFGLSLENSLLADTINETIRMSAGVFHISQPYPFWIKVTDLSPKNIITKDLSSIVLPWTSPIGIKEKEGVNVQILAQTSPYFLEFSGKKTILKPTTDPEETSSSEDVPQVGQDDTEEATDKATENTKLSAGEKNPSKEEIVDNNISLDPQQNFAFPRTPKEPQPLAVVAQKDSGGKVLFIGNTRFITREYGQSFVENFVFIDNAIDNFTIGDDLISIRSKQIIDRPLKEVPDSTKQIIRWINILGLPIFVMLFGLFYRYIRRKKRKYSFSV